jgi:hypothetical protein
MLGSNRDYVREQGLWRWRVIMTTGECLTGVAEKVCRAARMSMLCNQGGSVPERVTVLVLYRFRDGVIQYR